LRLPNKIHIINEHGLTNSGIKKIKHKGKSMKKFVLIILIVVLTIPTSIFACEMPSIAVFFNTAMKRRNLGMILTWQFLGQKKLSKRSSLFKYYYNEAGSPIRRESIKNNSGMRWFSISTYKYAASGKPIGIHYVYKNRLRKIRTTRTSFVYNNKGQITMAVSRSRSYVGRTSFYELRYSYDKRGRLDKMIYIRRRGKRYGRGEIFHIQYDKLNRIKRVKGKYVTTRYQYDKHSRLTAIIPESGKLHTRKKVINFYYE